MAYEALDRIAEIYHTEGELKELLAKERLIRRKAEIKPLVDDFFEWAKQCIADGLITKGKTLDGLKYCINQEKYLRVFLEDGEVPIDNSAAERSIRPFTIGKKTPGFGHSHIQRDVQPGAILHTNFLGKFNVRF